MKQWWRIKYQNGRVKYVRGEGQPLLNSFGEPVTICAVDGDEEGPCRDYSLQYKGETVTCVGPSLLTVALRVGWLDFPFTAERDGIPISVDERPLGREEQITAIDLLVDKTFPPAIRFAAETLCKIAKSTTLDYWDEGRKSAYYMVVWTHFIYEGINLDYFKEENINDTL